MAKKCLIAIALAALCGAPAMAHQAWNYSATTSVLWQWETHFGPEVPVQMHVVMWARLYYRHDDDTCLALVQQADDDNFYDCLEMLLCVNFGGILVGAQYVGVIDPTFGNNGENYRIAVLNQGEDPDVTVNGWSDWAVQPSDSLEVATVHLTGSEKVITICLEARDVDPQALIGTGPDEYIELGKVLTTLLPTIAPPGEPSTGILGTNSIYNWIP